MYAYISWYVFWTQNQAYLALLSFANSKDEAAIVSHFASILDDKVDEGGGRVGIIGKREENYTFLKNFAADLFKEKQFEASRCSYLKASEFVHDKGASEANRDKFRGFAVICLGNAAQCSINLGKQEFAVEYSTKALFCEPTNVKALYRRGISYLELNRR